MLSNSGKYAIKAVLFLALNSNEDQKILAKDIANPINAPKPYVAKILQELARNNIISSIRGPKGGFYLSAENLNERLINIVIAIDGEEKINSCVLGLEKCNINRPCPLHDAVHPMKSKFIEFLRNETVLDLATKYPKEDSYFTIN